MLASSAAVVLLVLGSTLVTLELIVAGIATILANDITDHSLGVTAVLGAAVQAKVIEV